jgi:hypothetical protein
MMILSLETRPEAAAEPVSYFDPKQRPVDLTHLSRYTMGNSVVEQEVLQLFRRQAHVYLGKLARAETFEAWRNAARVLKASAHSVGAWRLLHLAEEAEQLSPEAFPDMRADFEARFSGLVDEANLFIDSIL